MACRLCDPTLDPQGPREGEHHVAIRWGRTNVATDMRNYLSNTKVVALDWITGLSNGHG